MDCKVNWRGGVCRKGEVSGICHLQAATKTGYIGKKPVSGQVAFTTSVSMVNECQGECTCVSAVGASDETIKSTTMFILRASTAGGGNFTHRVAENC